MNCEWMRGWDPHHSFFGGAKLQDRFAATTVAFSDSTNRSCPWTFFILLLTFISFYFWHEEMECPFLFSALCSFTERRCPPEQLLDPAWECVRLKPLVWASSSLLHLAEHAWKKLNFLATTKKKNWDFIGNFEDEFVYHSNNGIKHPEIGCIIWEIFFVLPKFKASNNNGQKIEFGYCSPEERVLGSSFFFCVFLWGSEKKSVAKFFYLRFYRANCKMILSPNDRETAQSRPRQSFH